MWYEAAANAYLPKYREARGVLGNISLYNRHDIYSLRCLPTGMADDRTFWTSQFVNHLPRNFETDQTTNSMGDIYHIMKKILIRVRCAFKRIATQGAWASAVIVLAYLCLNCPQTFWAPFQYPKRRLSVRSRKVSKPRDWYLKLSYRFAIWQAHRQHCCRSACQISKRSDNSKYKSRGFETLRDLTERRLFGYWDGTQVLPQCAATSYLFLWNNRKYNHRLFSHNSDILSSQRCSTRQKIWWNILPYHKYVECVCYHISNTIPTIPCFMKNTNSSYRILQ